jgi:pyruvate/2-oxoglutarate dehydrogenase complex dihydrolipoamide dehydrogenase (E3) component
MPLNYPMMPRVTFCQPQVASFGYTEQQARDTGHDVRVATFPMQASAKAHGLGERAGFIKVVADATHGELLGAHLVGADVSELLPELTAAQLWDLTAAGLAAMCTPIPPWARDCRNASTPLADTRSTCDHHPHPLRRPPPRHCANTTDAVPRREAS